MVGVVAGGEPRPDPFAPEAKASDGHVCVVGRQTLPNLIGALELGARRCVLLYTKEERAPAKLLRRALSRRGILTERRMIDPYDPSSVRSVCTELLNASQGSWALNATGGTKLAAFSAASIFQRFGQPVFYVNTVGGEIVWLAPNREPEPIRLRLNVEDYLHAQGIHAVPRPLLVDAIERRSAVTRRLAARARGFDSLVAYFLRRQKLAEVGGFAGLALPELEHEDRMLLGELERAGLVRIDGQEAVPVGDGERYLGRGGWLEEYAFLCAREIGADDVRLGLEIETAATGGRQSARNEVDVVFTARCRLVLVSCKTGRVIRDRSHEPSASEEVYKLGALRELAGGVLGRAMLLSALRPSAAVTARCRSLRIELVSADELVDLPKRLRRLVGVGGVDR